MESRSSICHQHSQTSAQPAIHRRIALEVTSVVSAIAIYAAGKTDMVCLKTIYRYIFVISVYEG